MESGVIYRDLSTEDTQQIWAMVEKAASRTEARNMTLYEISEELQALIDTADLATTEEDREEIGRRIVAAHLAQADKIDALHHVLSELRARAEHAKRERERLEVAEKRALANIKRIEGYIVDCIRSRGADAKGRYPEMRGRTAAFRVQRNPPSLRIAPDAQIPACYYTATVSMPGDEWARMHADGIADRYAVQHRHSDVAKADVATDIKEGASIPGVSLESTYRLVVA